MWNMELYRPRSSSIPRQLNRVALEERFSVTDAVHLKLRLQALDNALPTIAPGHHGSVDIKKITNACQSRPFHEAVYVDGSEEFYLLVKAVSRPDLIPHVYVEAYKAVQQGRPHVNEYKASDFKKGLDPTFSDIRSVLGQIDRVCETDLLGAYERLEDNVKPFPFLRLPAELRLQVYSHLLPREPHIALIYQPHRAHKPPRLRLDIMRVNTQLHDETRKYLYENRTFFMIAARNKSSKTLSDEYAARYYETVARMNPQTRQLCQKLEIQVGYLSDQTFTAKRYADVPPVAEPMYQIFAMLPAIQTLVISFHLRHSLRRVFEEFYATVAWLVQIIPQSIEIVWDLTGVSPLQTGSREQAIWHVMQKPGSIQMGASVVRQLECARRPLLRQATEDLEDLIVQVRRRYPP